MAVFKCKMCGGTLEVNNNETVAVCEYCGTKQTLPKSDNEIVSNLYNRANNLRLKCEFDKAEQVYEKILEVDDTEAEAHWGIVLCKYGIEYVEDPQTYTRVPTCHRTSYDVILTDSAYLSAVANADAHQKAIYEEEAKRINEIQRGILDIVKNEAPFDVFICYKETDENGQRTMDSVLANDIYHQLSNDGFKVFYAAITLEDKLGKEYEPYIFAALNSAKIMLVIGTKPEYFEAVWVKNEWSRFMKLLKNDRSKLLIPCYRDMDAYDLPEEFSHLQAQDMSKIGFINDIERGIKKILVKEKEKTEPVIVGAPAAATNTAPLLTRAYFFLEDGDFASADEYCEKVLDIEPSNARAYLGKTLAAFRFRKPEDLAKSGKDYSSNKDYIKATRFADDELKAELDKYLAEYRENQYNLAVKIMNDAIGRSGYEKAAEAFRDVNDYKDSKQLREKCLKEADRLGNLQTAQENLTRKLNAKKSELISKKSQYNRIQEEYTTKKSQIDNQQKNRKLARKNTIMGIGLSISLFLFFVGVAVSYEMSAIFFIVMLGFAVGCGVFSNKIKKDVLGLTKKEIRSRNIKAAFLPHLIYIQAYKDHKEIKRLTGNTGELEKQVQDLVTDLNKCGNEISQTENEISQLTNKLNEIMQLQNR